MDTSQLNELTPTTNMRHLIDIFITVGCAVIIGVVLCMLCDRCRRIYDARYAKITDEAMNAQNSEDTEFDVLTEMELDLDSINALRKNAVSETEPEEYKVEQYIVSDFN